MQKFEDNKKRTWHININIDSIKRVRKSVDVDLLDSIESTLMERLIGDPVVLIDTIYVLCKEQADEQDVSDEDFGKAMAGDAIEDATTAFLAELSHFFPEPRRSLLLKAVEKLNHLMAVAVKAGIAELDSPEMERKLIQNISGSLSGKSPAS